MSERPKVPSPEELSRIVDELLAAGILRGIQQPDALTTMATPVAPEFMKLPEVRKAVAEEYLRVVIHGGEPRNIVQIALNVTIDLPRSK